MKAEHIYQWEQLCKLIFQTDLTWQMDEFQEISDQGVISCPWNAVFCYACRADSIYKVFPFHIQPKILWPSPTHAPLLLSLILPMIDQNWRRTKSKKLQKIASHFQSYFSFSPKTDCFVHSDKWQNTCIDCMYILPKFKCLCTSLVNFFQICLLIQNMNFFHTPPESCVKFWKMGSRLTEN